MRSSQITTYVWLTGQTDNIGDSALRRPYANRIRHVSNIYVWAGNPSQGYVAGLALGADELATSYADWLAHFWKDALLGKASFAFNPGEFTVTVKGFLRILPVVLVLMITRVYKNPIVWVGAGVRSTRRGITWPFSWIARSAAVLRWREPCSGVVLGVDAPHVPDWAFAIPGSGDAAERTFLAISLRGDRTLPPVEWFEAVNSLVARTSLTPIAVTQVRRDRKRTAEVAAILNCASVDWISDQHDEQEKVVRNAYSNASVVLSDRLHALIIGATEGAIPLGWTWHPNDKVARHFATVGVVEMALDGNSALRALDSLDSDDLDRRRASFSQVMSEARLTLSGISSEFQKAFSRSNRV